MKSHLTCKINAFRSIFFSNNSPLQEFCYSQWPEAKTKQEWTIFLGTLTHVDVVWKAPWMPHHTVVIGVEGRFWVPLIGIWGAVSYCPLLVLRQVGRKQHVPSTADLVTFEFNYTIEGAWKKIEKCVSDWRQTIRIAREPFEDDFTKAYLEWRSQRIVDVVLPKLEISVM